MLLPAGGLNDALGAIGVLGLELMGDQLEPHLNTVLANVESQFYHVWRCNKSSRVGGVLRRRVYGFKYFWKRTFRLQGLNDKSRTGGGGSP